MPNIYLRLPAMVCAFIRNRYTEPMQQQDPVVYSKYDEEYVLMCENLDTESSIHYKQGEVPACFTQLEWNNMMRGIPPAGGHRVIKRDPTVYLDYTEISRLTGKSMSARSINFDYLCIQIPQTVFQMGRYYRTNSSWKLRNEGIHLMSALMRERMLVAMRQWQVLNDIHCLWPETEDDDIVIRRKSVNMWERFLMHYDIPIDGEADRDSFKKITQRLSKATEGMIRKVTEEDVKYKDYKDKRYALKLRSIEL